MYVPLSLSTCPHPCYERKCGMSCRHTINSISTQTRSTAMLWGWWKKTATRECTVRSDDRQDFDGGTCTSEACTQPASVADSTTISDISAHYIDALEKECFHTTSKQLEVRSRNGQKQLSSLRSKSEVLHWVALFQHANCSLVHHTTATTCSLLLFEQVVATSMKLQLSQDIS